MLQKGKTYIKLDGSGYFPFSIKTGVYIGKSPGGFLSFNLRGGKSALMNGGKYKLVRGVK